MLFGFLVNAHFSDADKSRALAVLQVAINTESDAPSELCQPCSL